MTSGRAPRGVSIPRNHAQFARTPPLGSAIIWSWIVLHYPIGTPDSTRAIQSAAIQSGSQKLPATSFSRGTTKKQLANSNYKTEAEVQPAIASFLEFGDFDLDGETYASKRQRKQVAAMLVHAIVGILAPWDPFGIPSTSHWTGAAIIVPAWWTKTCIVTRSRTSRRPMPSSFLAG